MNVLSIAAVVTAATLVILAIFMIRMFIEVKKTMTSARDFMNQTETEIKPLLKELNETLKFLKIFTEGAAEKIEDVKTLMEAAGDTGRNLHALNRTLGAVTGLVGKSSIWMTGLKVAGKFAYERFFKKRR